MSVRDILMVGKTDSAFQPPTNWTEISSGLPVIDQTSTQRGSWGYGATPDNVSWTIGIYSDQGQAYHAEYSLTPTGGISTPALLMTSVAAHLGEPYRLQQRMGGNRTVVGYSGDANDVYLAKDNTTSSASIWARNIGDTQYNKKTDTIAAGMALCEPASLRGFNKVGINGSSRVYYATVSHWDAALGSSITAIRFARSTNLGATWVWHSVPITACSGAQICDIAFNGTTFCMVVNRVVYDLTYFFTNQTFHSYTSLDGINWVEASGPTSVGGRLGPWNGTYDSGFVSLTADTATGVFMAVTSRGHVLSSSDGASWSRNDSLLGLGFDSGLSIGNAIQGYQKSGGMLVIAGKDTFYSRDNNVSWLKGVDLPLTFTPDIAINSHFVNLGTISGVYLVHLGYTEPGTGYIKSKIFRGST